MVDAGLSELLNRLANLPSDPPPGTVDLSGNAQAQAKALAKYAEDVQKRQADFQDAIREAAQGAATAIEGATTDDQSTSAPPVVDDTMLPETPDIPDVDPWFKWQQLLADSVIRWGKVAVSFDYSDADHGNDIVLHPRAADGTNYEDGGEGRPHNHVRARTVIASGYIWYLFDPPTVGDIMPYILTGGVDGAFYPLAVLLGWPPFQLPNGDTTVGIAIWQPGATTADGRYVLKMPAATGQVLVSHTGGAGGFHFDWANLASSGANANIQVLTGVPNYDTPNTLNFQNGILTSVT